MSKVGKRLLRGAKQALEFAEGRAEPGTYRVHQPDSISAHASEPVVGFEGVNSMADGDADETPDSSRDQNWNATGEKMVKSKISAAGS